MAVFCDSNRVGESKKTFLWCKTTPHDVFIDMHSRKTMNIVCFFEFGSGNDEKAVHCFCQSSCFLRFIAFKNNVSDTNITSECKIPVKMNAEKKV